MKFKLIILSLFVLGCGKPKVFVLSNSESDKYYLSDSVKIVYEKGYIEKEPLLVIDGVSLDYQKALDTIMLPIKRNQITSINFVNKKSSSAIYGTDADNGAIILNTTALPKYTADTIVAKKAN